MKLTYLIASLPMLRLGEKPPLPMADFLAACEAVLPPLDMARLRDLVESDGARLDHPFSREWRDRETELRNAGVRFRAHRRQAAPEPFLRPQAGLHVHLQNSVAEAFQAADPLKRERALDLIRWRTAEELEGLEPFTLPSLFGYALRLRLAGRWADLAAADGADALDRAVSSTVAGAAGKTVFSDNTQKAESR